MSKIPIRINIKWRYPYIWASIIYPTSTANGDTTSMTSECKHFLWRWYGDGGQCLRKRKILTNDDDDDDTVCYLLFFMLMMRMFLCFYRIEQTQEDRHMMIIRIIKIIWKKNKGKNKKDFSSGDFIILHSRKQQQQTWLHHIHYMTLAFRIPSNYMYIYNMDTFHVGDDLMFHIMCGGFSSLYGWFCWWVRSVCSLHVLLYYMMRSVRILLCLMLFYSRTQNIYICLYIVHIQDILYFEVWTIFMFLLPKVSSVLAIKFLHACSGRNSISTKSPTSYVCICV